MFIDHVATDIVLRAFLLSLFSVCWAIFVVRVIGLRAFSKMTAIDFIITIAIGSLLAGACQASAWPSFVQPVLAIFTLLGIQYLVTRLRRSSDQFAALVQNAPTMLMLNGEFLPEALRVTRVSRDDVYGKLREANVLHLSDVRAVVLETTGDISVLHGDDLEEN